MCIRDSLGLDFDFPFGADQRRNDEHRRGGADRAEYGAMRLSDAIGIGGVGDIHAGAHNVGEAAAQGFERFADDRQAARGLHSGVADGRRTVGLDRRAAGDVDAIADPDRAAVTVHGLKGRRRAVIAPPAVSHT